MALERLVEKARAVTSRLSRRELQLLAGAGAALVLLVVVLVVVSIRGAIADRESRLDLKRQGLQQVVQLSSGFREAEAERRRIEAKLRGSKEVSLVSMMEELAKGAGVTISNMTPRRPTTKSGVTEETVDVSLEGITLDKLSSIINGIQRSPHMVKVRKLRVRKKFNEPEKVDASLTVATYSLEA